jgi:hypothetical protein
MRIVPPFQELEGCYPAYQVDLLTDLAGCREKSVRGTERK